MNLPNILTISRIVMMAIFVVLATLADKTWVAESSVFAMRLTALILAILAGSTDLLDGYLARKWNQVTDFGALMDPLADKIFVTGTMLMAVEYRLIPAWIAVAVLVREFMVTGLRTLAARKQVIISADRWGKLKTALQMVMLAIAGVSWVWVREFDLQREKWLDIRLWYVWNAYLIGIVLVTFLSGLGYFIRFRHIFLNLNEKNSN